MGRTFAGYDDKKGRRSFFTKESLPFNKEGEIIDLIHLPA